MKRLARGVVVAQDASFEFLKRECGEIGFARKVTAEAADGVLDAAFLPGLVGITEESEQAQARGEVMMQGELGAVVKSDGLAEGRGKGLEDLQKAFEDGLSSLVGLADEVKEAGGALVGGEDSLAVLAEEHEVGFPMAGQGAVVGLRGTIVNGDAVLDMVDGAAAPLAQAAAAGLVAGQEAMPVILLGGAMVDEAVDGLVADQGRAFEVAETTGDLLGRPTLFQVETDLSAKLG